jgi:hypothetical protein
MNLRKRAEKLRDDLYGKYAGDDALVTFLRDSIYDTILRAFREVAREAAERTMAGRWLSRPSEDIIELVLADMEDVEAEAEPPQEKR